MATKGIFAVRLVILILLIESYLAHGGQEIRIAHLEEKVGVLEKQGQLQAQLITKLLERLDHQETSLTSQSDAIQTQNQKLKEQDNAVNEMMSVIRRQEIRLKRQDKLIQTLQTWQRNYLKYSSSICNMAKNDRIQHKHTEPGIVQDDVVNEKNLTSDKAKEFSGLRKGLPAKSARSTRSEISKKRLLLDAVDQVAFHAVFDKYEVSNLGINQNIVFDVVLVNIGGSYHNQHGVFIAPRPGLYMFSTSIMSYISPHPEVQADLVKNGVTLARVFAHGDSGREDQGSVTIVTQLAIADEVWVRLKYPTGTSLYGGRFSSFTGYLIYPMES